MLHPGNDRGARSGWLDSRNSLRWAGLLLLIALASSLGACEEEAGPEPGQSRDGQPAAPAGTELMPSAGPAELASDPGEWPMPARDYASTRFSELDQIDTTNVGDLEVAWTMSTNNDQGHEAAPIVVDGTMFVTTPYPNVLYAIDLAEPEEPMWTYRPEPLSASQGVACCDVVNRGAAYAEGRVFFNTLDNRTIAVDAETGEELWTTRLGDIDRGETMTMAPLVVKDRVLVGNSGGEFGVRGWIAALDTETGEVEWRAYSTGSDEDVLIGEDFEPFYENDRGEDLGLTTWRGDGWRIGGGTVWGWISYDPELDLIYYGTSNPGPWNPAQRPGENKWTAGIFARDPDTGSAHWAYQFTPHDEHDYDGVNENILVDMTIDGERRPVLLRPERNGFFYVMDRVTGEVLSAEPFGVEVNWAHEIDMETGRPVKNEAKSPANRLARNVCPAAPGAKDWQPSSFSPRTQLVYIPHQNLCMDIEGVEANYIAGTPFVGARTVMHPGPGGFRGKLTAWDPIEQREVWSIEEDFPVWSGTVTTAGDVVFYGTMDRWFRAVNARTGEVLWETRVSSGIVGQPVTFLGPEGRQHVAVFAGVGGWAGAVVAAGLDPRDETAALGFVNAMQDLPEHTGPGGELYVFTLPEE